MKIILNGRHVKVCEHGGLFPERFGHISYADIVEWSGHHPEGVYTVTYAMPNGSMQRDGSLTKGESVEIVENMVFSVADTSKA